MTVILLKTETLTEPVSTRFDYSMTAPDGQTAYTHVLVRPADVIRRDTVPATAEKPARNARWEDKPATVESPAPNAQYETLLEKIGTSNDGKDLFKPMRGKLLDPGTVRTLVDPGTNEVALLAKDATEAEVRAYVTALMVVKEAVWIANKPAKAA